MASLEVLHLLADPLELFLRRDYVLLDLSIARLAADGVGLAQHPLEIGSGPTDQFRDGSLDSFVLLLQADWSSLFDSRQPRLHCGNPVNEESSQLSSLGAPHRNQVVDGLVDDPGECLARA